MRVYHDAEGRILYTLTGLATPPGEFVETADQDLGDLTAWRVVDGTLVRVSLAPLRAEARAKLIAHVTALRELLVTPLPGQSMIYLRKEAEARAWLSEEMPDLAAFPLLSTEVGITAPDADQLAQLWLNMADLLVTAGGQLEALRMTIGAAIDAAETPEEIAAAVAAIPT